MPGSNEKFLDRAETLARKVLSRIAPKGSESISSEDSRQLAPGQLADLVTRLEDAVEDNLKRETKDASPLAPDQFRVALTYEETSGFTEQYMQAVADQLSNEVKEYIVDRRYRAGGRIVVEVVRDVLARETTVKAGFDSERGPQVTEATPSVSSRKLMLTLPDASRFELNLSAERGPVSIGRAAGSTIRIDDPSISRTHCSLALKGDGRVVVSDLGSANGTAVNGNLLEAGQSSNINTGDSLRVGDLVLSVVEIS